MAPAGDPREVLQLLQQFQEIQQQRAKLYALLHSAFKEFMSSGQEGPYRRLLADLTPAFNNCSLAVIAVENELKQQQSRQDLAALLRSIQEHERSKLQLTMSLHALRQAHREQMFTWQNPPDPAADADAVGNEPAVHSHAGHRPGCIGCSEQTCSNPAQKVTRAEYEAAVGEAQLQLDNTVRGINEVLEELRYAMEELSEEVHG